MSCKMFIAKLKIMSADVIVLVAEESGESVI